MKVVFTEARRGSGTSASASRRQATRLLVPALCVLSLLLVLSAWGDTPSPGPLQPTPTDFERLCTWGALVISIIANYILVLDRNKAQKREISFAGTPVDKKDFDREVERLDSDIARVESKIDQRLQTMTHEAQEGRRNLHSKIEPLQAAIAGQNAKLEMVNQNVCQINAKIDTAISHRRP